MKKSTLFLKWQGKSYKRFLLDFCVFQVMEVCLALALANPQSDKAPGRGGGASGAQGVMLTFLLFLLQCEQEPNLLRTSEFETGLQFVLCI